MICFFTFLAHLAKCRNISHLYLFSNHWIALSQTLQELSLVEFLSKLCLTCPLYKMAAVTKSRNFFNCPLLLYFKSKWAQILTAAAWHWVVQHTFLYLCWLHQNLLLRNLNLMFGLTAFKIICVTFSINFRSQF